MPRIIIHGFAAVFTQDDQQVTDPAILRSLAGTVYDDERFTDYLGDGGAEDELVAALEPGGVIQFDYRDGELLTATTEYQAKRPLTAAELQLLVDYTMGQWSDGIGENWACESWDRCGYGIMCQTSGDDGIGSDYPRVEVLADE